MGPRERIRKGLYKEKKTSPKVLKKPEYPKVNLLEENSKKIIEIDL